MTLLAQGLYFILWALGAAVSWIPFIIKNLVAQSLGALWFDVIRFRRHIVLQNLAHVFPRTSQESMEEFQRRCETLARKNMTHYVLGAFEILERFHWDESDLKHKVKVVGLEHMQNALKENRGVFILTAHLGNWELMTMMGKLLKLPLAIVTKRLRNGFFDQIWIRSRVRYGLQLLEESGSGLAIIKAIRKGSAVGFILDQHTGEPHGIESTFLGLKAWCPKGLAILAHRLDAPIVPAWVVRNNDGTYTLSADAPLKFPRIQSSDASLLSGRGGLSSEGLRYHISICNEKMEAWIHKHPEQYLWLHRRFKGTIDYRSPLPWQL
jgi:KDO2-lipid IV(A) lauroyltransferase